MLLFESPYIISLIQIFNKSFIWWYSLYSCYTK